MDHAKQILAAVVPDRRDLLLVALQQLAPEHFREQTLRNIFTMLDRYYNLTGEILPKTTLSDMLARSKVDQAKTLLYEELFSELVESRIADHEFRYSIDALKDSRAHQLTGEAITNGMEILERGLEIDRVEHLGHVAARTYLYSELGKIDRLGASTEAPEGDIRLDAAEIRQEYMDRKTGKRAHGVLTGIATIDRTTAGFQNGELVLICAYTGEGKTQFVSQVAHNACVRQGLNVFFATSETVRSQVRRKIIARHSREEMFGSADGLNSRDIKNATLDPEKEELMNAVIDDFSRNPAYGPLYIAQIPRGGTLGFLESRLVRQHNNRPIDLVIIDYLALLKPDRRRQSRREEAEDLMKDAKILAATFADGNGVPVLSPWAMSQNAYRAAQTVGEYTLANLAETSEAEKSSDIILSLLRMAEQPNEVKMQFLKNRDGETPRPFSLEVDYSTSYMDEKRTSSMDASVLGEEFV